MSTMPMFEAGAAERPPVLLLVDEDRHSLEVVSRVAFDVGSVVRTAQAIDAAIELARAEPPAVVIAAIDAGGTQRGLWLGCTLRRRCGSAVVLTGPRMAPQHAAAIAACEPDGYLCKPLRIEQVEATVRLALKRRVMAETQRAASSDALGATQPDLAHALRQIAAVVSGTGVIELASSPNVPGALFAALRPREQEIVRLLFEHYRVPTIANRLGISPETVRNHLKNVFRRLGVHSQQELLDRLRAAATPDHAAAASADIAGVLG